MHLRDLGIKGWKAPEGGFKHAQSGLMEILSPANKFRRQEPIPMCDTEIQLQKMLREEHYRRHWAAQQQAGGARLQQVTASPSWPASDEFSKVAQHVPAAPDIPYQLKKPVQVTPRSGTMLEPSPDNEKRRCRQRTPKSFGAQQSSSAHADGLLLSNLVGLPGQFGGELSPVAEAVEKGGVVPEKLSKGILNQAQWNFGSTPGYYHNKEGKVCWGVQHENAFPPPASQGLTDTAPVVPEPIVPADTDMSLFDVDVDVDMDDFPLMRAGSPVPSPLGTPRSIQVC